MNFLLMIFSFAAGARKVGTTGWTQAYARATTAQP
jgi:hypothetical protein